MITFLAIFQYQYAYKDASTRAPALARRTRTMITSDARGS